MNQLDAQKVTIKYITDSIYTCEVATVKAFYPERCTADVQLLVKNVYQDGETEHSPLSLNDVPVRYPQMGTFVLYAPLQIGDSVYLHFSRSDWDNWLVSASNNTPVLQDGCAKHSSNCPYIEVGARNFANPARDERYQDRFHMAQGADKSQMITMHETGITIISGSSNITITPSGQINIVGNVNIQGTVTATDFITPSGTLKTHTHIDSQGKPTLPIG